MEQARFEIRACSDVNLFKSKLKTFLFKKYMTVSFIIFVLFCFVFVFVFFLISKGLDSSNNIDSRINIKTFIKFPDMFRRYIPHLQ